VRAEEVLWMWREPKWYVRPGSCAESLSRVLGRWTSLIGSYRSAARAGPPFWFTERTNAALLATAAWFEDAVALVEIGGGKVLAGCETLSEVDLWIDTRNAQFHGEAKELWLPHQTPAVPAQLATRIESGGKCSLGAACRAASCVVATPGTHRMGLVFVVPMFNPGAWEARFAEFAASWPLVDADYFAWAPWVPEGASVPASGTCAPVLRPGVLLVGRII
jgi:hypothetical protein